MKKLLTLGCSLSPQDHWPSVVSELYDNHTHYNFEAGGNQQLLDTIDEYLYHNTTTDLTVVYQLTGVDRNGGLYEIKGPLPTVPDIAFPESRSMEWNGYFGKQHMLWSDKFDIVKNEIRNPTTMITRIVSKLCLLSNAGANVCIFRGWTGALTSKAWGDSSPDEVWDKMTDVFDKNNVVYIDEPFVDWCIRNDMPFFPDDWHPTSYSSQEFAKQIITEKLT